MIGGTFSVSRRIWSHPVFASSEFSEREAFLWLVSEASWKPRTVRAGRVVVDLDRGQLCASTRFMAEAWGWSKSRVARFLLRLKNRDMIDTQSGTGQLIVTLCNYDEYQGERDTSGTRAGHKAGHERDSSGTNYKKDEIQSKKGKKDTNVSLSLIAPETTPPDRFDEFWGRYPRRVGKGDASKAYAKAIKKIAHDDLMFALSERLPALEAREKRFIPHPSRWLNDERWNDDIEPVSDPSGSGPGGASSGMVDAFAAVAARRAARDGGG